MSSLGFVEGPHLVFDSDSSFQFRFGVLHKTNDSIKIDPNPQTGHFNEVVPER